MIIMMMGPQACGKGTQGEKLSAKLGLPLIAVGQMLRDIPPSAPQYPVVQEQLNSGVLVDHRIVREVIHDRISRPDCINGFILDGWGRQMEDINSYNPNPDLVLLINIPREETMRRITGRRICDADDKNYNIYTMTEEEISGCKGNLIQRDDDTEEAVRVRLSIYDTATKEVIDLFRKKGVLVEIDGMGTPNEVFSRISKVLDSRAMK